MTEKTFVIIKPDGIQRQLIGKVIQRFEQANLTLEKMKMKTLTKEVLTEHYQHVSKQPFFPGLCAFMMECPVVLLILSGERAVARVRQLVGATDPLEAAPGTIRADFGTSKQRNVVHASDSLESATIEIERFFG
ncbi:nucleoside-diphosphate kinase [Candidatus Enterococcus willemsii]|uniref:Nucleoside diphosphate kinase n=1 Tax=Candidatus Enterococcus willemsii TaxID=1857215 RepID=A0ABQ6YZP9_9ENTE|nr:nucleoside-diphosphate kinase [Enterococcus sp. CU12B]KAF1304091.1 nucleoside-diphosphate kinase [Enterococcus sp. CU12B]